MNRLALMRSMAPSEGGPNRRAAGLATRPGCVARLARGAPLLGILIAGAVGAQPEGASVLDEGRARSSSHAAAERFRYTFEALESHTYLVTVDQRGFDLVVAVETPGGRSRSLDSPLKRDGREFAFIDAAVAGDYTVTVHSDEHTGARGAHTILLADLTTAEPAVIEAWRLMTRGAAANSESGEAAWAEAVGMYEAAAQRWHALGRTREQAQALYAAASVEYWNRYAWQRSADLARAAAALYGELGMTTLHANAVHLQAAALVERALEASSSESLASEDPLFDAALELLEQARRAHERLGNVYDLGLVLNNFGYTHFNLGELERARSYWERAAELMRNADEYSGELNPISNLAAVDAEQGNVATAIESYERILDILPPDGLERYRADTLDNLGIACLMFGEIERALQAFDAALDIQRAIDDRQGQGRTLRGMGSAYHSLGELEVAKTYLREALAIARATNDGRNEESILRTLGNIAYLEEDYEAALDRHRRALEIASSSFDAAFLRLLIAKDLTALGRPEDANRIASQALATAEQSDSQTLLAEALHRDGRAGVEAGEADGAVAALERSAAIYERLDLEAQQAEVLHSLALAARARGLPEQAVEHGEASLRHLERLRLRVAAPELRAYFADARREYYESQIGFLMALPEPESPSRAFAALETSERARARMIADLLQEASIEIEVEAPAELEERRDVLHDELAERSRQRARLLERGAITADAQQRLSALLGEIAAIRNELDLVEIELRNASPELSSLDPAEPLTASGMQALLDDDSVLLQYAFAGQSSYVWVVTRDEIVPVELASRAMIESAARSVLDGLESYSPSAAARRALAESFGSLSELVLAPVREHLDKQRIVLSLDGVLQYVPFAALRLRNGGREGRLVDAHEIVRVPSMSALAALRGRTEPEPAEKTLAVFADPVLGMADPRLAGSPLRAAVPASRVAGGPAFGTELQRLPSTAREAEAIAALVPEEQRFVARGFEASRGSVLDADLAAFRYIHFATHGIVNARYPGLSALAMTQFDEGGAPQNGLLRLHDIFGLELNADLVVLSACETALGKDVRGEGLIGLSQAFMYAGARSLVASLWQVPDRATSELMTHFYAFLLNDGLAPSEALRRAQLVVADEPRWRDPYFWGGFVLLGDWQ